MEASRLTRVALWSSFFRALAALHMFPLTQSHIVGLLLGWMALGDTATLLAMACMAGILEELNYLLYAEWIAAIVSVVTSDTKKT